jgi:hypothetical protein
MEARRLKVESWRVREPVAADLHHFFEKQEHEQVPDPDSH